MKYNAHVIAWLFWQLKKDAVWYHFPFKNRHNAIVLDAKSTLSKN